MTNDIFDEIESENLRHIYLIWKTKCGADSLPSRDDIDPVEFGKALRNVFLIDIKSSEPKLLLRVMGTAFEDQYGENISGRFLEELDFGDSRNEILQTYEQLIETKAPVYLSGEYEKTDGRLMRFERITLPLSDDGEQVTGVLGGIEAINRRPQAAGK